MNCHFLQPIDTYVQVIAILEIIALIAFLLKNKI